MSRLLLVLEISTYMEEIYSEQSGNLYFILRASQI